MANIQTIQIREIDLAKSPRVRAKEPDQETIEQYAANYSARLPMPPIIVFYDVDQDIYLLADGRHRIEAVEFNGGGSIQAEVIEGDYNECLKHALIANAGHGVPRSNSDKRQCVKTALLQWGAGVTDTHIANITMVSDKTVAAVRAEMMERKQLKPSKTRTRSDGQEITVGNPTDEKEYNYKDVFGKAIPHKVQHFWERRDEMQIVHDDLDNVYVHLKDAQREKDVMFAELNFTDILANLEHMKSTIKGAIPYCVCTQCNGHPETQKEGCRLCLGRGLIGKFKFDNLVPLEIKKIMKAGLEKGTKK